MAEFEKSLERYDVLDRIAVGGMAEVFLAKAYGAHGFEKTLAIKRILPELARDPEFEARFIAEAKVAVKLAHANVVQVLDFGRLRDTLFIAMEYVDGLDLAALLRRYKDRGLRLPLQAAFQISIELARGLDFAHSHGVVHRDVSPSNILLSRAGEVKIADFGIAVAARPHRSRSGVGPRKVMGKWRYMSPEQALGEVLDTRSDLFSAAAVMYEMFTGDKLFPGDDAEEILRNIQQMPIPSLRVARPELPARLDEVLAGPLARRPGDRPARAALLVRALTELSYESSIVATSLDVAEAVGAVLEPAASSRSALDDLIRAQLGGAGAAVEDSAVTREKRKTAVGTGGVGTYGARTSGTEEGTGVFVARVDGDGVSHLELDAATFAAQPRARRATGDGGDPVAGATPPAGAAASDEVVGVAPEAPEAPRRSLRLDVPRAENDDPDRHTQVGPPLDESRPLVRFGDLLADDGAPARSAAPAAPAPGAPRTSGATVTPALAPDATPVPRAAGGRRRWLAVAGVGSALVAGVLVVRGLSGGDARATIDAAPPQVTPSPSPSPVDAARDVRTGTLDIVTTPAGATGKVGDVTIAVTPAKVSVPAGVPLRLELELARYQRYVDDAITVGPGEVVRIRAPLVPALASLVVTSVPTGAQVTLDGRRLGETPLERSDLEPRTRAVLTLSKDGYAPVSAPVVLTFGETTTVHRELRAEPKYGELQIAVSLDGRSGWADAYLRGKKVGRASVTDPPLRLPVGPCRLRLVNPVTKAEATLEVTIVEGKNPSKSVTLRVPG